MMMMTMKMTTMTVMIVIFDFDASVQTEGGRGSNEQLVPDSIDRQTFTSLMWNRDDDENHNDYDDDEKPLKCLRFIVLVSLTHLVVKALYWSF